MVVFRKMISPKSRKRHQERDAKLESFRGQEPGVKAAELLAYSRILIDSGRFSPEVDYSYDESALYRVIPEIALRLDPHVKLRPEETPQEEERARRIYWIHDGGTPELNRAALDSLRHGFFSRASVIHAKPEEKAAVDLLFGSPDNMFAIAADAVMPGFHPASRPEPKAEPLDGFYLIGTHPGGYDRVLAYCDDLKAAEDCKSTLVSLSRGEEVERDKIPGGARYFDGMHKLDSISIQNYDGEILDIEAVAREERPEESPGF